MGGPMEDSPPLKDPSTAGWAQRLCMAASWLRHTWMHVSEQVSSSQVSTAECARVDVSSDAHDQVAQHMERYRQIT
jgi:hypothetical protein